MSSGGTSGDWSTRLQTVLMLVLVPAIVGAGVLFVTRRPPPTTITVIPPLPTATPPPTATPLPTATPGPITVYVTGAVQHPEQLVMLPFGSRVADAVEAAGGLLPDADLTRINLAGRLRDGDQVHVFAASEGESSESVVELATPSDAGVVYVNTASREELVTLPRIGEAMAQRIIDYREANGAFETVEDLLEVNGIGPATLETIRPYISLEIR